MKLILSAFIVTTLLFNSGCAMFDKERLEKPAQELVQDGIESYDKGKYSEAIQNFEQLKDWYPFSKYAILAELKIADAHYHLGHYAEAVMAYEEFEQLHPRNEAIAYVIYQTGRCYYEQIDTVDRDQSKAKKALETFQRLVRQYPEATYSMQARTHIQKCLQSLAGHEFYVGLFYFKTKHYQAARERFLNVVTRYPDVGVHHKALHYIAQCESMLQKESIGD